MTESRWVQSFRDCVQSFDFPHLVRAAVSFDFRHVADRLTAAEGLGAIDKTTAQSLREAFAVIYQVRLEHQAQQVRSGLKPDNLMRPARLAPLARAELREAFNAIGRAQQQLSPVARLGA
jgi:Putative nucleotidyltransferase substrate binding domain